MSDNTKNEVRDINDILNIMDKTNTQFTYGVWVPSLEREVQFTEMTTKQQKAIVKTIVDSSSFNTNFINVLNSMIKENCAEKDVDIDNLTIIDKFFILIKMRSVCVDKIVEIEKGECIIDLEKVIEEAKNNVKIPKAKTIKNSSYKIFVNVPTIKNEKILEVTLAKKTKPIIEKAKEDYGSDKNLESVGEVMSETYTFELIKHISAIEMLNESETIKINFDDLDIDDKIKILDKVPNALINDVVEYIQNVKKEIDKILVVKIIDGKDIKEERLSITGDFFMKS